jgi:phosphatidylinositol alpha 1,6-mannosyltransferase
MSEPLRVALFTDSFHELNGVATVSREFQAYAQRRGIPFCCVHSGPRTQVTDSGSVRTIELKRGMFSFKLDENLYCDPLLNRYRKWTISQLESFRPDLIHITGPGDMGILGFWVSHNILVPKTASWHTNLHEYAGRRVHKLLRWAPEALRERTAAAAEHHSLRALMAFYRFSHFTMAPNQSMVDLLQERTQRPAYGMKHGVDGARFSAPSRATDGKFCIGWVGRLTPEKNVRAFVDIERQLLAAGERNFRFLIVGDGGEREWLRRNLQHAEFPGFLTGDALASAFASMDAFVFPSRTDTFGLVLLEAMASGVPAVLGSDAAPRVGVRDGVEGFVTDVFIDGILKLMRSPELRRSMGAAARRAASLQTWDAVFDGVYKTYEVALETEQVRRRLGRGVPVVA